MGDLRNPVRARVAAAQPPACDGYLPAPVPVAKVDDLAAQFAQELAKLGGELIEATDFRKAAEALLELAGGETAGEKLWFVADRELALGLGQYLPVQVASMFQLPDCLVSIVEADVAIADTATVGLALDVRQPRGSHLLPEISVVVVRRENLKPTLMDALLELEQRGKLPTVNVFVTGPSRTADIEKTVVIPAHGPKRLVVVLYG